jgi:hypothetical protein
MLYLTNCEMYYYSEKMYFLLFGKNVFFTIRKKCIFYYSVMFSRGNFFKVTHSTNRKAKKLNIQKNFKKKRQKYYFMIGAFFLYFFTPIRVTSL